VQERGTIETPILLTNTLNTHRVADGLTAYMLRDNPDIGVTTGGVNPVVGECHDGFLNDMHGRHVHEEHVFQAIESATDGPVVEGCVGAGTGTQCFRFKGGIGTASRHVHEGRYTVGALVQSNYGRREQLLFFGAPVGQHFLDRYLPEAPTPPGSIMMVLATDAPFTARQLGRLAMRAAFGLARTGSTCQDGSGDFVIAFSTSNRQPHDSETLIEPAERIADSGSNLDPFFLAVVESIEEAILNSLLAARTITGRDGNTLHALPHDELVDLLEHYRRV
jgi:D-aminopeptidase